MERILMLLAANSFDEAEPAIRSAADRAASMLRLTFGLCLPEEPDADSLNRMCGIPGLHYAAPSTDPWHTVRTLWQGEAFILMANPGMRFAPQWDIALIRAWRLAGSKAVLSGCPPEPADPVDAVSPIGVDGFDADGCLVPRKGTPLRYAAKPQPGLLLHPACCFAPAAFFTAAEASDMPAWAVALQNGWQAMTLHQPVLRQTDALLMPPQPIPEALRSHEGLTVVCGIHADERTVAPRARTGLFTPDHSFPMRVPSAVKLQEASRARVKVRAVPLMVTALTEGFLGSEPSPEETIHDLTMLCAIKALPLLAFADAARLRWIEPLLANTVEFKRRYALRLQDDQEIPLSLLMPLSKAALLTQARERQLNHSHYGWLDPDVLRWPVAPCACLQWDTICTDGIVLAIVDGEPDTTAVIVPENYVLPLRECMAEQCRASLWGMGELPDETSLWQNAMKLHPQWFRPVELPAKRRLLSLTMTARGEEFHTEA